MQKTYGLFRTTFLLIAILSLAYGWVKNQAAFAASAAVSAEPPTYIPFVMNSGSTTPLPPEDEASTRISVPAGFEIRIFAIELGSPRLMATGPDGWVYAARPSSGDIIRLPDRNHDGISDGTETVASGLNSPHNLEWHADWMYVAETGRVSRLADADHNGTYEQRELVTNNIPGSDGHSTRTLHFGPDGKLYVSAGSSSNTTPETDPRRAAILRFNPDGSIPADNPFAGDSDPRKQAVWAWGLRNSVDFLWTPDGALWADHNGSDNLGDSLPPEEIMIPVQRGKSHGWPYCYTPTLGVNQPLQNEVRDTRLELPNGFTCDQAVPARLTIPAHSAPLGMTAAGQSGFPTDLRDDIFVALHGSWNTSNPDNYRDCKVERVIIENGIVTGSQTFATGWQAPGNLCGDGAWGRPAGVVFGSDGALYISDDANGRVFRVVYTGTAPANPVAP